MRSPVIAMHGSQDAEEGQVVVDTPHRRNHRRWSFDRDEFLRGGPWSSIDNLLGLRYIAFSPGPLLFVDGLGRLLDEVQDCRPGKLQNPFR